MDNEKREALAERCLEAGALVPKPGEDTPLVWDNARAQAAPGLREWLTEELVGLVREHYSAGEALLGDDWAREVSRAAGLPLAEDVLPARSILILGSSREIAACLPRLAALRRAGGSPAVAVIWNGREEGLLLALDRADIRCHWLLDLESGAAAALQSGRLDFADYCRLLPQD